MRETSGSILIQQRNSTSDDEDIEKDPDLIAWREERMNRHRRSSFENEQIHYLRLNLPPSTVNMKGSLSAHDIKGSVTSPTSPNVLTPHSRRKISLAGISPNTRKRRLSRAGTRVADMVRAISSNEKVVT